MAEGSACRRSSSAITTATTTPDGSPQHSLPRPRQRLCHGGRPGINGERGYHRPVPARRRDGPPRHRRQADSDRRLDGQTQIRPPAHQSGGSAPARAKGKRREALLCNGRLRDLFPGASRQQQLDGARHARPDRSPPGQKGQDQRIKADPPRAVSRRVAAGAREPLARFGVHPRTASRHPPGQQAMAAESSRRASTDHSRPAIR